MIIDHIRDLKEFKKLWLERPLQTDVYSFDFIINNPHLYCFYSEKNNKLLGYISLTQTKKGKLFLSGASLPKIMPNVVMAIIYICEAFKQPMYSDTDLKPAILVLKKAGFKRLRNTNIYKRSIKHG